MRLLLIDAHYLLHKAEHGGFHLTYTATRTLISLLDKLRPTHVAAIFDTAEGRQPRQDLIELYERHFHLGIFGQGYKGHRESSEALIKSRQEFAEICQGFGVHVLAPRTGEADDLIATLTAQVDRQYRARSTVVIFSNDRDLFPLLGLEGPIDVRIFNGIFEITAATVWDKYGLRPEQIPDYLALVGKPDQIPGVPGVGQKTAVIFLGAFKSLLGIYDGLDEIAYEWPRMASLLQEHWHRARLSYRLALLNTSLEDCWDKWDGSIDTLERQPENRPALRDMFHDLNFVSLLPRVR